MSERDYILSEEYLNDNSYLDFKNSFTISVNLGSQQPNIYSPKSKGTSKIIKNGSRRT